MANANIFEGSLEGPCTLLAEWIHEKIGFIYNKDNFFQLEIRLKNYIKKKEITSLDQLYFLIRNPSEREQQELIDLLVNNETFFLREIKFFEDLEQHILPEFIKQGKTHLDIWSMACSYGQEVYSLAFTLEKFKAMGNFLTYKILGSDISDEAICYAEKGIYTEYELDRGEAKAKISNYFDHKDGKYEVKQDIKRNVSFQNINLNGIWGVAEKYDMILCRNALYYLDEKTKDKVVATIPSHLNENGLFVLSGTENLLKHTDLFLPQNNCSGGFKKAA